MRWEKAAKKAREREQEKIIRDRMFKPVDGWLWCEEHGEPHVSEAFCQGDHRKLWVERTGGSND